ncbi:tyrosine-type recombinase/integrase [Aliarcobacter cibarius]|uniref:Site-specific tyrosine recombinase, phage integrase family (INT_ICEBs1_C_like domain) n=1 Tax=Aliarcobacter cibarius TaxID=255507 RepID=A0A7L5JR95_9BACT|nr:site-specific integrase [Aliarcobacter cibarius]QKJ27580.1 site-specific tyrosine recombinase, phage integrase family (INT_ICEBs1_C_like domain) [Aliarcobacter cibarius]TLT03944.1 site-specific integrase [Aliarcobacter cibarius]
MKLYNRNGILYIYLNGVRKSSGLKDTQENRKLLTNHHKNDEFYKNFNVITKDKTIIDFCEEVLQEKENKLQPTTMRTYYSLLRSRIIPFFNKKYIHEVTPIMLKTWYSTFKDKSTLNTCVNGILKSAFENAIIEGYIKTSPFIVSFPTLKSDYEINPFNLEEINLLLKNSNGWFRNFLGIAFFTGARTGELLALEWKDINFTENIISINKTRTMGLTKRVKTKSSKRNIDILSQCEIFLKQQQKITGLQTNVFYSNRNQSFGSSSSLANIWNKLLKKCNLEYRSIYQTRHSFASNMLSNKEDIFWVSQMLGHKNINITSEKYSRYIRSSRERKTTFLDEQKYLFAQI